MNPGEQDKHTSQAFQEGAEERPSTGRGQQPGEGAAAGPGTGRCDLLIFSSVLAGWPCEHLLDRRGVGMHVYEVVTTTQGALRLLSASQAYSGVLWAELIDGQEQKRQVG